MPLTTYLTSQKLVLPETILGWEDGHPVVPASASVPVEVRIQGLSEQLAVGVDVVFVIDNSGSMDYSDPSKERFLAVRTLATNFQATRSQLDRVAIVIFQDSGATVIDAQTGPWKSWSNTILAIDQILATTTAYGATPIAAAMRSANSLFTTSDRLYRLAILISDGLPEPDDPSNPQTATIQNQIIPNECVPASILYSTIYLRTPNSLSPEENALLAYIAKETDYITDYVQGEPPQYHFRIGNVGAIGTAYGAFFQILDERASAQKLLISEKVNARLLIDAQAPVTFSGSGFDASQNLISIDSQGQRRTIDELLAEFRNTKSFRAHLNDLQGEDVLRFSVKLDMTTVTNAEYQAGGVLIPVDVFPGSNVEFRIPLPTGDSADMLLNLPQAYIKFKFGLHVTKRVDDTTGKVTVSAENSDVQAVRRFEIAEYPATFSDVRMVQDDFDFHPFQLLYKNRIMPWMLQQIPFPANTPSSIQLQVRNEIEVGFQARDQALRKMEALFDQLLSRFYFSEELGDEAMQPFGANDLWRTPNQRGLYYFTPEIPPGLTRSLSFDSVGASYLVNGGTPVLLSNPADAREGKTFVPMSRYQTQQRPWVRIEDNPYVYQSLTKVQRPDLFCRTCFDSADVSSLGRLFLGEPLSDPWAMLQSEDLSLHFTAAKQGVTVRHHNAGHATANGATVSVRSVFLPITDQDRASGLTLVRPFKASRVILATGSKPLASLAGRTSNQDAWVPFDQLFELDANGRRVAQYDVQNIANILNAVAITTVQISAATDEVLTVNNSAIQITKLKG